MQPRRAERTALLRVGERVVARSSQGVQRSEVRGQKEAEARARARRASLRSPVSDLRLPRAFAWRPPSGGLALPHRPPPANRREWARALVALRSPCPNASRQMRRSRPGLLARPGDHSAESPPGSIPNPAVKLRRAQGTALLRVGERVVARSSEQSGIDLISDL